MKRFYPLPSSRERVLDKNEFKAFVQALWADRSLCGTALKLCLLTVQRRGEVAGMRWDEIDPETGIWKLGRERTKNSKVHEVPLSPQAMAIIEDARRYRGRTFVLASRSDGEERHLTPLALSHHVRRMAARLDLKDFRLHDIRRTAATKIAELDEHRFERAIPRILNHSSDIPSVTGRYDRHTYLKMKRSALDAWGEKIESLVRG